MKPALAKLPELLQEQFSKVPEEVRKYKGKDGDRAELMAIAIAKEALERSELNPSDIDYIIGAAVSLHKELGFNLDTPMLNIADCCASFIDACQIAWNLVSSGECKRVLVVASAALAGGPNGGTTDLTNPIAPIFGDGAAAAIVSSQNLKCEFLSYHFETYAVSVRTGGTLIANFGDVRPLVNPDLAAKAGIENKSGAYLILDDPLFNEIAGRKNFLADSLERALKKVDLKLADLDTIIAPHIGDLEGTWIDDIVNAGLSADTYKNLRKKYGNTAVADVLLDLAEFGEEGQLVKDSIIALWSPCSGVQLATLVLQWLA